MENPFVAVDYRGRDSISTFRIHWHELDAINVMLKLPDSEPGKVYEQAIAVVSEEVEGLQTVLANHDELTLGDTVDFYIQLRKADDQTTALRWSAQQETAELGQLRAQLERLGHLIYVEAKAYLERGRELGQVESWAMAAKAFRTGLDVLSNQYVSSTRIDDTGMKLVLAQAKEREGNLPIAANLYERILADRVQIYAEHRLPVVEPAQP